MGNAPNEWALRSKAALLLALATKQSGPACWEALVPRLLKSAEASPVQAEKVSPSCTCRSAWHIAIGHMRIVTIKESTKLLNE